MLTTGLNLCQATALAGLESAELDRRPGRLGHGLTKVDIETAPAEDGLKRSMATSDGPIRAAGKPGDQVDLTSKVPEKFDEAGSIFSPVIDPSEEHIFEGQAIAVPERVRGRRRAGP